MDCLSENPIYHSLFGSILSAAIRWLFSIPVAELRTRACSSQIIYLIKDIYQSFIRYTSMPRVVFESLPNMDMHDLQVIFDDFLFRFFVTALSNCVLPEF